MTRGQNLARQILGDDFIAPEEVVRAKQITYTLKQLQRFAKTMPAAKVLQWLKQHNYMLLPGKVGDDSKVKWLALRKDGVPDSRFKTYKEQGRLLSFKEYVPSMGEVIWGIGTYFDVRGIRLMNEGYCVRTSSNPDGQPATHVRVGPYLESGMDVNYCPDDYKEHGFVLLAAARKL
ncbi:MAG: hypothetical protein WC310_04420 [Patescibacteria group bacterium]|jgi:hypothetical protein